jgi:hypothetical protein
MRIPYLDITHYSFDKEVVKLIPEEMARCFQVIALDVFNNIMTVGMVNPKNLSSLNVLEGRLKYKIIPIQIDIQEWAIAINTNYTK